MGNLVKLTPAFSCKIWGGQNLSKLKSFSTQLPLGETWEISTHRDGVATIGKEKLSDLCELSYLFKFIDTDDNLSIQVHPEDEYAQKFENDRGKTECWIILKAEAGAGIYLGFKEGVTKKEFKLAIENGLSVEKYLNFVPVKPGDYFYVPAGSIHALGKGLLLAEAQQSSGVTYRVWDWNRLDDQGNSRELHLEKAMDVINFSESFNKKLIAHPKNIFASGNFEKVVEHDEFKVDYLPLKAGEEKELRLKEKEGLSILSGEVFIDNTLYTELESGICFKEGLMKFKSEKPAKVLLIRE